MSDPDVSIIIAAWKSEGSLPRAVASALTSKELAVEVVIVDDMSPDETYALAKRLAGDDPRIIADRLPVNGGPSAARNRALALATGRFIAVLDADDAFAPDRLSALVHHADATGADIMVDNMVEVDEAGDRLKSESFLTSPAFAADRDIDLETWIAFNQPMKGGDCIGYLKPLIRRSALPVSGAAYDTTLRNSEDYYLIANLLAEGRRMQYLATPGYLYTRSSGSTSYRLKPEQTLAWLDAERRFAAAYDAILSQPVRAALARRRRALRHVHQFIAATDAVKARRLGTALGVLASDLRGAAFTLAAFGRIAMGKMLRRKLV